MAKVQNCPACGNVMMNGWCPHCHPNPKRMSAYRMFLVGNLLHQVGCLVCLVVFVVIPMCVVLYACATSH